MVSSKYKVETENRKNRYYNLYDYRVVISIRDIQKFRYHNSYDDYINYKSFSGSPRKFELPNKDEICRYFDYKNTVPHDCKIRLEYDTVIVYTNELAHLDYAVDEIDASGTARYYKVNSPKEEGTIEFAKEPKYKFRNYFKAKNVSAETKAMMLKFINEQQDNGTEVEFNDAMIKQLKRKSYRKDGTDYLYANYFVDYNDESLQALFALMFGEYLNPKIFRLVKR
jgi:hypothetical protein